MAGKQKFLFHTVSRHCKNRQILHSLSGNQQRKQQQVQQLKQQQSQRRKQQRAQQQSQQRAQQREQQQAQQQASQQAEAIRRYFADEKDFKDVDKLSKTHILKANNNTSYNLYRAWEIINYEK